MTPEQQLKVLAQIWDKGEGYEGYVFLPWIKGGGDSIEHRRKSWSEGRGYEWPRERDAILQHLKDRKRDDLYFTPNIFAGPTRISQLVVEEKALYADLDEVDPRTDIDNNLRPTIAWESSPDRFQAVWLLDTISDGATEPGKLNQRLTSQLGADPSGWDTTQLLRVPGRDNYKPQYRDEDGRPAPGKLLWVNSRRYSPDKLDDMLPTVQTFGLDESVEDGEIDDVDRHAVWARVRMKCSGAVRTYMSMKSRQINPEEHDRSEILWQIERDLADAGCTVAEIVAIVRHTPWNKHEGRRNELSQLKSEALKAKGVSVQDAQEETLEAEDAFDGTRPDQPLWFSNVVQESIPRPNWLVRNIWTAGSCGFIAGQPKSYKSYFGLDLALSVATGTPFLNDPQFSTRQAKVLYLQEEDGLQLVMHRAEQIVSIKSPERHWHGQLTFDDTSPDEGVRGRSGRLSDVVWTPPVAIDTLALHVRTGFVISNPAWQSWLADFVDEHGFELVIIDTLGTTVGDIDTDKSAPMNLHVLKPLREIADSTGTAIAIIHHNKKGDGDKVRSGQQMLGSVAIHAWVESALYVQSKEKLTDSPHSEVRIERENKLAEDMKFRVRVPTMFAEKGHGEEGARVDWDPEVLVGWGDSNAAGQVEEIREELKQGKQQAGGKIAEWMEEEMGSGEWHTLEDIVKAHDQNRASVIKQLNRACGNGLMMEQEGSYKVP